jgi:hypothetical protein
MSFKQLFAEEIDGVTNAINTNITAYTVPTARETVISSIVVNNWNAAVRDIRMYHVPSGGSAANENRLTGEVTLRVTDGQYLYQTGICMSAGDFIVIRSDGVDVNFIAWGEEKT